MKMLVKRKLDKTNLGIKYLHLDSLLCNFDLCENSYQNLRDLSVTAMSTVVKFSFFWAGTEALLSEFLKIVSSCGLTFVLFKLPVYGQFISAVHMLLCL